MRKSPTTTSALLLAATLAHPAVGQKARSRAGPDPYTRGEQASVEALGYVSLGPFQFGTGHDTASVEELLGTEPLVWIETAHFRIGCALSPLRLRGQQEWSKEWIKKVRDELDELRPKLPKGRLKKRVKELDPWLRAHLMAQRLERLYEEVLEVLGRDDAWFAAANYDASDADAFTGQGPYLGMREKFAVLMLQKGSSIARYTRQHRGGEMKEPIRHCDLAFGSIYWGCSEESANGLYKGDYALHSNLVFNVANNLYSGYRCFGHNLPAWLVTGLSHWHSRRVSPRFPVYDRLDDTDSRDRSPFWDWDARVRGLVKYDAFGSLADLMKVQTAGQFGIEQHMQAWAVVGYLVDANKEQVGTFLHRLKSPFHGRVRMPTDAELQQRQQDVFVSTFGCEPAALDAAWREATKKRKPGRKR